MKVSRKRLYFRCPVCSQVKNYGLLVREEAKNQYLCETCGAIATPKYYLTVNVIHGALIGLVEGLLAYFIFTRYLFESPPVYSIVLAAPFTFILSWFSAPLYSRVAYRWTKLTTKRAEKPV